jgi:hypothetical protein
LACARLASAVQHVCPLCVARVAIDTASWPFAACSPHVLQVCQATSQKSVEGTSAAMAALCDRLSCSSGRNQHPHAYAPILCTHTRVVTEKLVGRRVRSFTFSLFFFIGSAAPSVSSAQILFIETMDNVVYSATKCVPFACDVLAMSLMPFDVAVCVCYAWIVCSNACCTRQLQRMSSYVHDA